jgi:hypothetical protein
VDEQEVALAVRRPAAAQELQGAFLADKASDRKLRLLAVACCRRVWPQLTGPFWREAVERSERFADRQAGPEELAALTDRLAEEWRMPADAAARVAVSVALDARAAREVARVASWATPDCSRAEERLAQCRLVREVFGNPFRPVSVPPAWLTPQVVALARAAYDERDLPAGALDTRRLAVLADAVEDAGCTCQDILGHLRGPGPHYRGCWAVDLLLGQV